MTLRDHLGPRTPENAARGTLDRPLPTLFWPDDNPPPSWWGISPTGELTKCYRSYEDYCDD